MKRHVILLTAVVAGLGALFSACSKDVVGPDSLQQEGDVLVTTSISPKDLNTVSTYSVSGMLDNSYVLRYTTELYLQEGEGTTEAPYTYNKLVKRLVEYETEGTTHKSTFRVPAGKYAYLVWVDYVKQEGETVTESFYDQASLKDIKKSYGLTLTTDKTDGFEVRDAFRSATIVTVTANNNGSAANFTIRPTHAVAKVNVIAQDVFHLYSDFNGQDLYTTDANKLTNKMSSIELTYTTKGSATNLGSTNAKGTSFLYQVTEGEDQVYVSTYNGDFDYTQAKATYLTDYVIVEGNNVQTKLQNVMIKVNYEGGNVNQLDAAVNDVPVRPMYVTNLVGDILTKRVLTSTTISEAWSANESTLDVNGTTTSPIIEGTGFQVDKPLVYNTKTLHVATINASDAETAISCIKFVNNDIIESITAEEIATYGASDNKNFKIIAALKQNNTAYYRSASFTVNYSGGTNVNYTQTIYQAANASNRNVAVGNVYVYSVEGETSKYFAASKLYNSESQTYTVTDLYGKKVGNYYYTYIDVVVPTKRNPRSLALITRPGQTVMGSIAIGKMQGESFVSDAYGVLVNANRTDIADQAAAYNAWDGETTLYVKYTVRVQTNFNAVSTKNICNYLSFKDYDNLGLNKEKPVISDKLSAVNMTGSSTELVYLPRPYEPTYQQEKQLPFQFGLKFNPRVYNFISSTNTSVNGTESGLTGEYLPVEGGDYEFIIETNRKMDAECISTNQPGMITKLTIATESEQDPLTKVNQYKVSYTLAANTNTNNAVRSAIIYVKPYYSEAGSEEDKFNEAPTTVLRTEAVYQKAPYFALATYKLPDAATTYYGFVNTSGAEVKGDVPNNSTTKLKGGTGRYCFYIRSNRFSSGSDVKAAISESVDWISFDHVNVYEAENATFYGKNFSGEKIWRVYFDVTANETSRARSANIACKLDDPAQTFNVAVYQDFQVTE